MLSINHDDDYIGFKLRARYTLPRLGGYKKMCHQRGGLRPHQQEKHQLLLQFNYIILWISNSIELHRLRVCAHTNIFYVFPDGGAAPRAAPWPYRILKAVRGAAHGRTISVFSKTSSRTSLRMNARACTPRAEFSDLEKYGAAFAKVPKLEVSRSPIHTEITYYVTPPLPLHQPDLILVPATY